MTNSTISNPTITRSIFLILSGFTRKFDFNIVKKYHCFSVIALLFFTFAYHVSKMINLGLNPHFLALSRILKE